MKIPVVMSWSGGKDSAIALHELPRDKNYEVVSLLTTLSEQFRRISHHGVRESLLDMQAETIGIPLHKVYLPSNRAGGCTNEVYESIMKEVMLAYLREGVETVAFGDLFLEDLRAWRETNLAKVRMHGLFPIWKRDTTKVARKVIEVGYRAYLSCVDPKVGLQFAGRLYDMQMLRALPPGVDPCGENGEFHSFVFDGPIFKRTVAVAVGDRITRNGRHYADLRPTAGKAPTKSAAESTPLA
jgi:uncharacterized protein (TIGR00290 family)